MPAGLSADRQSTSQFAEDVRCYLSLTPRQLPSRYFYDALGSALFDAICQLPWYNLTRAELRLLVGHAAEIFSSLHPLTRIVELGAGSGEKLATLLAASPAHTAHVQLHLIDVSRVALEKSSRALSTFDGVRVVPHQAPYEIGLEELRRESASPERTLVLFLGSNIGNFDPAGADALLCRIRGTLRGGDSLLIGADLVKPERDLLLAYDDPLGVTAAFNRNLLARINRELEGNFDLTNYAHRAVWNRQHSRIEMHLVAARRQSVEIAAAALTIELEDGETIWTESSYKFRRNTIVSMLERNGFRRRSQWVDPAAEFALTLVDAA